MEKKTIGSLIAALRRANGMTQRELAERLNVSDKTVSRWERDEGTPELALIPVLAEIFGVTCDELLRGERRSPDSRETESAETTCTQRGEKQRRRLLKQALSDYRSRSCIVVGLSALGLLAALICNLAFLRASLGFLVGAVFFAAAAVCQYVFVNRAFLAVEDSELAEDALADYRRQVLCTARKTLGVTVAGVGFTLPLLPVDAYLGLGADTLLLWGCMGMAAALVLYAVALYFVNGRLLKQERFRLPEREAAVYARRHRLKRYCALGLLAALLVTGVLHSVMTSIWGPTSIAEGETFTDYESFVAFMEREVPEVMPEGQLTAPLDEVWYDEYGNEISEEQARTRQLTDKNGQVVCEYVQRNRSVVSLTYTPQDGTVLPITARTQAQLDAARNLAARRHVLFGVLYGVETLAAVLTYGILRKRT